MEFLGMQRKKKTPEEMRNDPIKKWRRLEERGNLSKKTI